MTVSDHDDPDGEVRALLTAAIPADLPGVAFGAVATRAARRHRRERVRRALAGSVTTLALAGLLWTALGTAPEGAPAGVPGQPGRDVQDVRHDLDPDVWHRMAALVPIGTVVAVTIVAVLLAGVLLPRRVPGRTAAGPIPPPGLLALSGLTGAVGVGMVLQVLAACAGLNQTLPARPWITSLAAIGGAAAALAVTCLALDGRRRKGRFPGVATLATPLALVAGTGLSGFLALWATGNVLARLVTAGRGAYPWSYGRVFLALGAIGLVVALAAAVAAYRAHLGASERGLVAVVRVGCLLAAVYVAQFTGFVLTGLMTSVWEDRLFRPAGDDVLATTAAGIAAAACGWALIGAGRAGEVIGLTEPLRHRPQVRTRPPGADPALRLLRMAPHVIALFTAVVLADLLVFWLAGPGIADNLPLPRVTATGVRVLVRVAELAALAAAAMWAVGWVARRGAATASPSASGSSR